MNRRAFISLSGGMIGTIVTKTELLQPESEKNSLQLSNNPTQDETVLLYKKQFIAQGNREQNECYNPVIDHQPGSKKFVFLRVSAKRESLIFKETPETGDR